MPPSPNRRSDDPKIISLEEAVRNLQGRDTDHHKRIGDLELKWVDYTTYQTDQLRKLNNAVFGGGGVEDRSMKDDLRDVRRDMAQLIKKLEGFDPQTIIEMQKWQEDHDMRLHNKSEKKDDRQYALWIAILLMILTNVFRPVIDHYWGPFFTP